MVAEPIGWYQGLGPQRRRQPVHVLPRGRPDVQALARGSQATPWGGASVSSGLGSAGASIGHHASVNDVRESAFEAAQRLVPTLASGEFATEVAVAFGARHARLGERRDVERPVQLAVSTAAEAMALDLPARHLKRRRRRVAGVARARGEATDRSAAPHDLRRQDHADAGDAREGAALYAQRCLEAARTDRTCTATT